MLSELNMRNVQGQSNWNQLPIVTEVIQFAHDSDLGALF